MYIDKIEWTTRQVDDNGNRKSRKQPAAEPKFKITDVTSPSEIQHVAVVTGRIPVNSNNYRETVNKINNIIDALTGSTRVETVSAIRLPVDVRPEQRFASESRKSLEGEQVTQRNDRGKFSLKVIMRAPENV